MLRPSPNPGTLWLPSDDDDSLSSVMVSYIYQHKCLDTLHGPWNNPTLLCDWNSAECIIPSYNYLALLSAALLEQHPCHIARAIFHTVPLSSQYSVDVAVDQALIPPSILAPEGKHGGYGT